jgi:exodeoxyribonuclease-5
MTLTEKQLEGLKIAITRYNDRDKYTVISGYAGTGKSTLVRFIIDFLDVDPEDVAYACYTGKAAEVLRKKGNKNAMTLHKLLYDSFPRPGGGFFRKPKKYLDYEIVVVDEISMAPKSMIEMLLTHDVYCIFLGDPFQLPQIDKNEAHNFLDHPHIFLDEVMRQAAESEIIQTTMKIREGRSLSYMTGKEVMILPKESLTTGHMLWADTILCATNKTRHYMNEQMRHLLGYEGTLQSGEKIIIKRNYWEDCNEDGEALVNGIVGTIQNPIESFVKIPPYIKNDRHKLPLVSCEFIPDGGKPFESLEIDKDFLLNEEPCVDWKVAYQLGTMKNKIGDILPKQATYGYALTVHAAQGSEWDKVLVMEEGFPFDKKEHARWLYTAATRASEKLVLMR